MKVKLTRNLGTNHPLGNLLEGVVHDLADEHAANLLEHKLAEACDDEDELHGVGDDDEDPPLRAVPKGKGKAKKPAPDKTSTDAPSIDPLSDSLSAALGEVKD